MTTMLAPAINQSVRSRNGVVHEAEWDVYLYGWREVPHRSPNGKKEKYVVCEMKTAKIGLI